MSLNKARRQRLKEKQENEKEFVSRQVRFGPLHDFPRSLVIAPKPIDPYLASLPVRVDNLQQLEVKRIKKELSKRGCHTRGLEPQLVRRLTWAIKRDCRWVRNNSFLAVKSIPEVATSKRRTMCHIYAL